MAAVTKELTDAVGLDGETGLEVVAAFVYGDEAATAEEDLEALIDASRDHLREGHKAPPALPCQHLLEGRTALQLLLMTHSIYYWREFTSIFTSIHNGRAQ